MPTAPYEENQRVSAIPTPLTAAVAAISGRPHDREGDTGLATHVVRRTGPLEHLTDVPIVAGGSERTGDRTGPRGQSL